MLMNSRVRETGGGVLFSMSESINKQDGKKNSTKERFVIDSSHGSFITPPPVAAAPTTTMPMPVSYINCLSLHISYT